MSQSKRRKEMKRMLAVLAMVALAFTMISGCADVQKCNDLCQSALDKAAQIEQSCAAGARAAEASAQRAEAAARRAEAAADKCEQYFKKGLKK
jgi:outer membrane murein-binding lipoprotein Lpp